MTNETGHIPVLFNQVIGGLSVVPGKWYLDLTFGRGGHTRGMLALGAKVIAFDQDNEAIKFARRNLVKEIETKQLILVERNFEYVSEELQKLPEVKGNIFGALFDFGVSSNQLEEAERGFSFQQDAPLDMRMSLEMGVTARDLVNALGKRELERMLIEFAQESNAKRITDLILTERKKKPIETTRQLADLIEKRIGRHGHLHPATKTFMALRMLVNDELGVIERGLPQAFGLLEKGGRLAAVSFHEGEDRIVKHFMKEQEEMGVGRQVTGKPLEATDEERKENPRSRSAKLRIIEKTV
jgi:16S rRNA (cytosine1402-N4)-methyltransferase